MKNITIFILCLVFCASGRAGNMRFKEFGTPIPARANLDVRWNAPTNAVPSSVWVYHLLPRKLSPQIISNLMSICSFTAADETQNGDLLIFNSPDGARHLRVSWPWGVIDYQTDYHYGPTNLTKGIPTEEQSSQLTKELLTKLDISLSDVERKDAGAAPNFHLWQPLTMYFINHTTITNVEFRAVTFRRAIDGIPFVGAGTGGDGEIRFGERGAVSGMLITWRNVERDKRYPTVAAEAMVRSIREGRAVQGFLPGNADDIDWRTVKSVTVKKLFPSYYAGGGRFSPSDWLYPFAALDTTVDTGHGTIDVEIDCPIIDETGQ